MSQCYHTSHNSWQHVSLLTYDLRVLEHYYIITWNGINTYMHQMCNSSNVQFWNVWQATRFPQWIHKILRRFLWNSSVNTCVYNWFCNTNWLQRYTNDKPSRVIFGLRCTLKAWETHYQNTGGSCWQRSTKWSDWSQDSPVGFASGLRLQFEGHHALDPCHCGSSLPVSTCNWDLCEDKAENSYLKLVFIFPWQHRHLQKAGLCHDFGILVSCLTAPLPPANPSAKRIISYHHTLHCHYLISSLVLLVRLHWVSVLILIVDWAFTRIWP